MQFFTNNFAGKKIMSSGDKGGSQPFDVKLLTSALEAKFRKMLNPTLELIQEELYRTRSNASHSKSSKGKAHMEKSDSSKVEMEPSKEGS